MAEHALKRTADILAELKRMAEAGEMLPPIRELPRRFGCTLTQLLDSAAFLRDAGAISIDRDRGVTVITICSTGDSTARTEPMRRAA